MLPIGLLAKGALSLGAKFLKSGGGKAALKVAKGAFPAATGFAIGQQVGRGFGPSTNGAMQAQQAAPGMACPTGFRLNKSTYVTRGGGTSRWPRQLQVHEKKTVCVKRRKMNAGNGRAAVRAVRRLTSFYRLSQRVAKQLRRAASAAKIGGRRGRRALPAGTGVQVIDTD